MGDPFLLFLFFLHHHGHRTNGRASKKSTTELGSMADSRKAGRLTAGASRHRLESEALRSEQVWSAEAELAAKGLPRVQSTSPMQTDPLRWPGSCRPINSALRSSRPLALRRLGHLPEDVPAMAGIPLPPPGISPLAHSRPLPGPADEQRHPDPRKQSQDVNDPFVTHAHPVFKGRTIQPLVQSAFHAPIIPIHVEKGLDG